MALSKDDLDVLDEAIASGELSCTVNGKSITYRSIDELTKARRHVESVLRSQGNKSNRRQSMLGPHFRPTLDRGV